MPLTRRSSGAQPLNSSVDQEEDQSMKWQLLGPLLVTTVVAVAGWLFTINPKQYKNDCGSSA